jgi:translocator protein
MTDRQSQVERTRARELLALAGWLAVTFLAAFIGSRFEPDGWYRALEKPSWNPPSAVFAPVWTTLYTLMAIAAWMVWRRWGFAGARAALGAYFIQLALNAAWSWQFFGRHAVGAALLDILLLLAAIVATIVLFRARHRVAALLLVPYLAWVTFATALTFTIWRLNAG